MIRTLGQVLRALLFLSAAVLPPSLVRAQTAKAGSPVVVASKPFGESFILAELFAQLLERRGFTVDRRPGLGATEVAFSAVRSGAVDVYPEYTGTGLLAVLKEPPQNDPAAVFARVAREFPRRYGVRWLPPLGFENTYAIAVRRQTAEQYSLETLTDLAGVAQRLTAGLTADFIERKDGLPGLKSAYGMSFRSVRPLGQAVKYQALTSGAVDVIDGYSTDGFIAKHDLVVLRDDKRFFPPYEAAALVSGRLYRNHPRAIAALVELSDRLDVKTMRRLNARLEVDREPVDAIARSALQELGLIAGAAVVSPSSTSAASSSFAGYMWSQRQTLLAAVVRHLMLVTVALVAGMLVAIPLGLWLDAAGRAAEPVIRAIGLLQTIPSIALLAFMIPLIGIGVWPALVALWLYSLYPIVRSTYSGVRDADPTAVYAARALGMTPSQILRQVRLPLAAPTVLAGIRTAAVIAVGTATLAAFIGAGGLGEPIATGLALADTRLILSGALPAAALALVVDALLAIVERVTTPAPLRHAAAERFRERMQG
ncbi:MAG TPA: glycine betaine ABC transporter substrate-binding protein [Gemmatimonadaceae bacterium]|nr:glycine betaine ABC transporter substrate-binding protein [Gemmatimonadaceae bacterium]